MRLTPAAWWSLWLPHGTEQDLFGESADADRIGVDLARRLGAPYDSPRSPAAEALTAFARAEAGRLRTDRTRAAASFAFDQRMLDIARDFAAQPTTRTACTARSAVPAGPRPDVSGLDESIPCHDETNIRMFLKTLDEIDVWPSDVLIEEGTSCMLSGDGCAQSESS